MSKLLRAGYYRYTHSLLFWICIMCCAVTGVLLGRWSSVTGFEVNFYFYPLLINASLISLMLGREFSDGMFRPKIAAGHSKGAIFLSEAILALGVTVLVYTIHFVLIFCQNLKVLGYVDIKIFPFISAGVLLTTLSFTCIFVFVSCLISRKTVAAIINVLLIMALFLADSTLTDKLNEPRYLEYMQGVENEQGETVWTTFSEPNAKYIDEPMRSVLETADEILPFGQFTSYCEVFRPIFLLPYITETNRPAGTNLYDEFLQTGIYAPWEQIRQLMPLPLYQLGLMATLLGLGCIIFSKKDFR